MPATRRRAAKRVRRRAARGRKARKAKAARPARARKATSGRRRPRKRSLRHVPNDKPLAERLGIRPGTALTVLGPPPGYVPLLGSLPDDVRIVTRIAGMTRFVHVFAHDGGELQRRLVELRPVLSPDAVVWVSHPKPASAMRSDLTRDSVRAIAEPFGLTPVAQLSIDDTWSALRFKRGD